MLIVAVAAGLWALLMNARGTSAVRIHASVVFAHYGERTPPLLPDMTELTPLGAQQMFSAGAFFRSRYITSRPAAEDNATASRPIWGLRTHRISDHQVHVGVAGAGPTAGSALAFMQGLYPPLDNSSKGVVLSSQSLLANGSNVVGPLGGYQYPRMNSPSILDPDSIWLAGDVGCAQHAYSTTGYFSTREFAETSASSQDLYGNIAAKFLRGAAPGVPLDYRNAFPVFESVRYGDVHVRGIHEQLQQSDLARLRALASRREYAANGNLSASGLVPGDQIRAVAGKTLAAKVLRLLTSNVESRGSARKINLLFGNHRPFLAFFALARLPDINTNFYDLPELGSIMVFELFSAGNATADDDDSGSDAYPEVSDLMVRFLFRNGTTEEDALIAYPVSAGVEAGPTCGSRSGRRSTQMRPVVAGVVGSVVTLGVVAIVVAATMLLGRVRFYRAGTKRPSADPGGFRGAEKLASDPDLVGGKVQTGEDDRGHARVGSWELTAGKPDEGRARTSADTRFEQPQGEEDDATVNPYASPVPVEDRF
ncbi:MAG: hypothetical protein M1815_002852 [Lichina confinis]|nr:MAG: hypothetical protein M1815_002852 [Lichina confinis]